MLLNTVHFYFCFTSPRNYPTRGLMGQLKKFPSSSSFTSQQQVKKQVWVKCLKEKHKVKKDKNTTHVPSWFWYPTTCIELVWVTQPFNVHVYLRLSLAASGFQHLLNLKCGIRVVLYQLQLFCLEPSAYFFIHQILHTVRYRNSVSFNLGNNKHLPVGFASSNRLPITLILLSVF